MNFLEQVYAKRKKLADVLGDEEYSGIREIVEELYPDKAHFVYELLQNAEDTGATLVKFILHEDMLVFEHNGRAFQENDVWGITNIGKGTKKDDEETIGKFGIGFKAVFAYTETPRIWSPTFTFEISELVLPKKLPPNPDFGKTTHFEFPFNNPKKSEEDACDEVREALKELSETTLLFLTHIESILWELPDKTQGQVRRIHHSAHHIEILKQEGGKSTASSHFLRFTGQVEGLSKQCIAVAYALELLLDSKKTEKIKKFSDQFKIVPALPGRVAVFFPAEKETSGLRFHLHAPFVPELSRASIKETPVNSPLLKQLANLTASSLHEIRDLGLLTAEFLAVLPNPQDTLPMRYQCIREAIITAMNEESLTPTHLKSHAPAKHLLQAKATLKSLLTIEDLEFLCDYEEVPPNWAVGATQKNSRIDQFLSCLEITDWDLSSFVHALRTHLSSRKRLNYETHQWVNRPDDAYLNWLSKKSDSWHQKFYALLQQELDVHDRLPLKSAWIIRMASGEYNVATSSYFPTTEIEDDVTLPRVAKSVYTSGQNKTEQDHAKKFLEELGVREVGEIEQVEVILRERYSQKNDIPDRKTYLKDLKRFISLVEKEPTAASMFGKYYVLEGDEGNWYQPESMYLDTPYLDTGLRSYYEVVDDVLKKIPLSDNYLSIGISQEKIANFTKSIGVNVCLKIERTSCNDNPDWGHLMAVSGERYTSPINEDYTIRDIDVALSRPTIELSRLVWNTMCRYEDENTEQTRKLASVYRQFYHEDAAGLRNILSGLLPYLRACYQKNSTNGARYADSQLVHHLKKTLWIPQGSNSFVRLAEARPELLPAGFLFNEEYAWLTVIGFGEESTDDANHAEINETPLQDHERQEAAKILGFDNEEAVAEAHWFARLPQEERQRIKKEIEKQSQIELPENEPTNPNRRADRVADQASDAPERNTEKRIRSVSVGREAVKKETDPYLTQQYTNGNGEMICQVCKTELPFKLADGSYYFEAVEFLPDLKKRHYQNYLTLCPNHAAMFRHANGSADLMLDMLMDLTESHLDVILAEADTTIYFTKTHLADLKVIVTADREGGE